MGSAPTSFELLERTAELEATRSALEAAERGQGGCVLVRGTSGLGKTSVLSSAASAAESAGLRVLRAAGHDLEEQLPWGVTVQLFGETVRDAGSERLFSGAAALARPLLEGATDGRSAGGATGAADPFPLLHGLHWLVVALSEERPLLLVVDDLHWSDLESLRFLNYLQGRIGEQPSLLIGAIRPGERDDEVAGGLIARLRAHPATVQLALSPLSPRAVHQLVEETVPGAAPGFCAAIAEATGGNPFFARQLAEAARAEGLDGSGGSADRLRELRPERIRAMLLVRLAMLGPDAVAVASAVALLGPGSARGLVCSLARLDGEAMARASDVLAEAGILVPGEVLSFAHPIVREVIYADIPPERRARDHRFAAGLLHSAGSPVEAVASQLLHSEPVGEAWAESALREAAARAAARGAAETGARLLRRALAEADGEDPALLLELGAAETRLGDRAGTGRLESALDLARDPGQRAAILATLAAARYAAGDTEGVVAATRGALQELPPGGGGRVEAELLFNYGMTARAVPLLMADAAALIREPRMRADGAPAAAEFVRLMLAGFDAMLRGDHRDAGERLRQGQERLADPLLAPEVPLLAQITLQEFRAVLGHPRDAERAAAAHLEAARSAGSRLETAIALEARAGARWFAGDLPGAAGDAELALELSEATWNAATVVLRVIKALVLLERGELDAAGEVLEVPQEVEAGLVGSWGWFLLPVARGRLALAGGDASSARAEGRVGGERLIEIEAPTPGFSGWRLLVAQAAARLGERDEALAVAREEFERAEAGGALAPTAGAALATLGIVEGGREGLALLGDAVETLERSSARLERARALVEFGAALRRAGLKRDARDALGKALREAGACEARALADRAAEEYVVAGGRPRRAALTGVEALTPGERRVAEMAAEGLANREIAEALFVTRRTVETHLTHVYSKLGIRSRAELPPKLSPRDEEG